MFGAAQTFGSLDAKTIARKLRLPVGARKHRCSCHKVVIIRVDDAGRPSNNGSSGNIHPSEPLQWFSRFDLRPERTRLWQTDLVFHGFAAHPS
jgi:hypothetical protein